MCNPMMLAVATFAAGAAKNIAEFQAGNDAFSANQDNAIRAATDDQNQLTLRQIQEEKAHAQKTRNLSLEGAEAKAEAEVAGGARGIAGVSLDSILADIGRKVGADQSTNEQNWKMTALQLQKEKDATITTAKRRIAEVPRPSLLGLGADIAGSALKGYTTFKSM